MFVMSVANFNPVTLNIVLDKLLLCVSNRFFQLREYCCYVKDKIFGKEIDAKINLVECLYIYYDISLCVSFIG